MIDRNTVRIRINSNRQYALTTRQSVRRLRWEQAIVVDSLSGWTCVGEEQGAFIHSFGVVPHQYEVLRVDRLPQNPDPSAPAQPEQTDAPEAP